MSRTQAELVRGRGAHADALACLEGVDAELAARLPVGSPYSIYALVWHMTFWMDNELERIAGGRPAYPERAALGWPPADRGPDEAEWVLCVARFARQLGELQRLAESPAEVRARAVAVTSEAAHANQGNTVEDVVWQTLVHNSHHLGQVVLLRRLLGAWPPAGGGDTW
jgi:uncharacterized damage-inducible protein DinB